MDKIDNFGDVKMNRFKTVLLLISIMIYTIVSITNGKENLHYIFNRIINSNLGKGEISSSYFIERGKPKNYYGPGKAFDRRNNTAWVTRKNNGINEYIYFRIQLPSSDNRFPKEVYLFIVNGYTKNEKIFKKNNRVKRAILKIYECQVKIGQYKNTLVNKPIFNSSIELNLKDTFKPQKFDLIINNKQKVNNDFASFMYIGKLIIKDIYRGLKNDTCISEIYFKPKLSFLKK